MLDYKIAWSYVAYDVSYATYDCAMVGPWLSLNKDGRHSRTYGQEKVRKSNVMFEEF